MVGWRTLTPCEVCSIKAGSTPNSLPILHKILSLNAREAKQILRHPQEAETHICLMMFFMSEPVLHVQSWSHEDMHV